MSASRSWAAKPPSRPFELSDSKRYGYLLLTYAFARGAGHIIKLNDRDLPWVDIFPSNEATTHLKPIASHFLVPGLNTLQIVLNGPALLVYYAVVHWRALDNSPSLQVHP